MQISKVVNANVYIDGTNNLLGRASEIALPDIAVTTEEHMALGMIGKLEIPTGLEAMTASVKWAGFYAEVLSIGGNPYKVHQLQVRAQVETYDAGGRVAETPLVVLMSARWKKTPLGTLAAQKASESAQELSVTYIKVTLGGVDLVEIDIHNNIWTVAGEDVLANFRANLGA